MVVFNSAALAGNIDAKIGKTKDSFFFVETPKMFHIAVSKANRKKISMKNSEFDATAKLSAIKIIAV